MSSKTPDPSVYNANYYGISLAGAPTANYRDYGPDSQPHWSLPLAHWLEEHRLLPVLDLGCAYGHLVRDINGLASRPAAPLAVGVDWSEHAIGMRVSDLALFGDIRKVAPKLAQEYEVKSIVSLDCLEHLSERDGANLIQKLGASAAQYQVHVIGCPIPEHEQRPDIEFGPDNDPTHANTQELTWYLREFARSGFVVDDEWTKDIRGVAAWRNTDWQPRIVVLRREKSEKILAEELARLDEVIRQQQGHSVVAEAAAADEEVDPAVAPEVVAEASAETTTEAQE